MKAKELARELDKLDPDTEVYIAFQGMQNRWDGDTSTREQWDEVVSATTELENPQWPVDKDNPYCIILRGRG